jgi:hypothetical protein
MMKVFTSKGVLLSSTDWWKSGQNRVFYSGVIGDHVKNSIKTFLKVNIVYNGHNIFISGI